MIWYTIVFAIAATGAASLRVIDAAHRRRWRRVKATLAGWESGVVASK